MYFPIGMAVKPVTYPIVSWITDNVALKLTKSIKNIICTAQGNIVEFRHFIRTKDRELNSIYDETMNNDCALRILGTSVKSDKDKKAKKFLEDREEELSLLLKETSIVFEAEAIPLLGGFIKEIEKDMLSYFEGREYILPRLSVKMILGSDPETGDILVEDIFRGNGDHEKHYWEKRFSVEENTAFSYLVSDNTQDKYLCNNIPEHILKDNYKNARIDLDKARKYSQPRKYKWRPIRAFVGKSFDKKWIEVWKKSEKDIILDEKSCYKSTLVVPISFNGNNKLSHTVKLALGAGEGTLPKGFLCLDHHYTDYFRDGDVELAYIVADMFSILWQEYLSFNDV